MVTLVLGGSGSGKSQYAEQLLCRTAKHREKYYIATMQVYDEEAKKKVARHRSMRDGKGFITVEQTVDIERIHTDGGVALLECISNLTANEMFRDGGIYEADYVVKKVIRGIEQLITEFEDLVIVTNNVFEDGTEYDATTRSYIRAMGIVNQKIAEMADRVIEVVVGIPVFLKKNDIS